MSRKRLLVTGLHGQVVSSLLERAGQGTDFDIISLGRPTLDLARPELVGAVIRDVDPDAVVSAAAHTAVDQAETEEPLATLINAVSAGEIAKTTQQLDIPLIHLSTDYVFDGSNSYPYVETDPTCPLGAYGRSKLAGEKAVQRMTDNQVILRLAWVYSPFGKNFLKTMLRLAETRREVSVVDDQVGNPTSALDIADGILAVAGNLITDNNAYLRGTFHMTASGEASWADFAKEIFIRSKMRGAPAAMVKRISSCDYPTLARRPANSRLDSSKLANVHGVALPSWHSATEIAVDRLIASS